MLGRRERDTSGQAASKSSPPGQHHPRIAGMNSPAFRAGKNALPRLLGLLEYRTTAVLGWFSVPEFHDGVAS